MERKVNRSLSRGIGPPKRASTFELEQVAALPRPEEPVCSNGPCSPVDSIICWTSWMMRGAECAALLGDQVIVLTEDRATLALGATKADPGGSSAPRTLLCSCREEVWVGGLACCPVHALLKVMERRRRSGLGPKDPLFADSQGRSCSRSGVRNTLKKIVGDERLGEHSARRAGAQYYARRRVATFIIQFLGTWGSDTVMLYIANALNGQSEEV